MMVYVKDTDAEALAAAADGYRQAILNAEELRLAASADLTTAIRKAYANGAKKADILRATGHVWSRTWLDNALKGVAVRTEGGQ